nr:MarR family transcriptional regulator [Pseudonocardia sp. C8]
MTVEQWWVLHHLAGAEAAPMSDLVTACRAPAPTTTRIVDKLVENALVHRGLDGMDRRRVLVRLAPRGRELVTVLAEQVEAALDAQFEGLAPWQAGALEAVLREP